MLKQCTYHKYKHLGQLLTSSTFADCDDRPSSAVWRKRTTLSLFSGMKQLCKVLSYLLKIATVRAVTDRQTPNDFYQRGSIASYASAGIATAEMSVHPSVRLSVCLSHPGIVSTGSRFTRSADPENPTIGSNTKSIGSGCSTLGPGGHRPPKSCPGPPNFWTQ